MADYKEIIEILMEGEMDTVGRELAIKKTREVPEVELDDEGNIQKVHGDPERAINNLLDEYEKVSGSVVVSLLARKLASDVDRKEINIRLPSRLEEKLAEA